MLQQLRKYSKSPVASVVIGILVLAFALWGVADIFRGGGDTVVADVGSSQISDAQYDLLLKNQIRALSTQTQTEITMEQARAMGLDRNVLEQAIGRAALDERTRDLGLVATRSAIEAQFTGNSAFRGAGGAFDPLMFQRALQESGYSVQGFYALTGQDIVRRQMVDAITDGMAAPPGLARLLYDFFNEKRTAEYVVVTPEEAGQVAEPSASDLEAYHKAHADQFSSPEYRAFDYVQISPEQVAGEVQVSDADVKAEYDVNKAKYEKAEQRDVEQIAFPNKEAAEAAATRIKTAADFASVARERGLSAEDVKLGTFSAAAMDPRLSAAAIKVPAGGVTEPVQGPFGWVILRAARVVPGENKSLDEVKDEIKAGLVKDRARAKMADVANAFEDQRGSGATIADVAMKLGLPVRHVVAADRNGMTPEGAKAEIPAQPVFMQQVFQTESGEETDLFSTEDGASYAVKVNSITPPTIKPLEQVRDQVRNKLLQAKVQAFADQAMKAGSLAEVGRALRRAPVTSMPLKRAQTDDVFSTNLSTELFAATPGAVVTGPAGKGNGHVIARVAKVEHPEPDVSDAQYAQFRQTAAQQLSETAVDSLAAAARRNAGVTVHQATVQRIVGEPQQ
jgi:peptidyl-prolyl cis-trans isomerase D